MTTLVISRRDLVLDLLRQHRADGVTRASFDEAGIGLPGPHIESLRFEPGIGIEARTERCGRGYEQRWYLVRDEAAVV